jgi:hypothetical protein
MLAAEAKAAIERRTMAKEGADREPAAESVDIGWSLSADRQRTATVTSSPVIDGIGKAIAAIHPA